MKVVTADEMRGIDEKTMKKYGISGPILMERAGLAVATKIRDLFDRKKVIVLSGGGHNGADGFAVARNLYNWGWNVKVFVMVKEDILSQECRAQYQIVKKTGIPVEFRTALSDKDFHGAVVVDALLGTGLNKPVASPISDVISHLNRSDVKVVSVDIPSGISSDDGRVRGEAVAADYTVTFGLPKCGHLLYPGAEHTGRLFVEDIGFPRELLCAESLKVQTIERADAALLLPERRNDSHKGDYGHVLIIAGSRGTTGAALMAAKSCLKSGAGMVTLGVPETLMNIYQCRVTEEMVLSLPDTGQGILSEEASAPILDFLSNKADVLAIGPGISTGSPITKLLMTLLMSATTPMVLDADAINSISGHAKSLLKVKAPVVLTPHTGEMARLLRAGVGKDKGAAGVEWREAKRTIERDRVTAAVSFSKARGAYLVLKGAPTIISEPGGRAFINTTGNPGMATAGAGDVLTGIVAAFLGQGLHPADASILGVYLHGLAGDIAAAERSMYSLIASDIIEKIPEAFMQLKKSG
jgi:ADP-dependent NAD(P)H-hydrate dehydratase / NAD(P)H-hydrate epimerase